MATITDTTCPTCKRPNCSRYLLGAASIACIPPPTAADLVALLTERDSALAELAKVKEERDLLSLEGALNREVVARVQGEAAAMRDMLQRVQPFFAGETKYPPPAGVIASALATDAGRGWISPAPHARAEAVVEAARKVRALRRVERPLAALAGGCWARRGL